MFVDVVENTNSFKLPIRYAVHLQSDSFIRVGSIFDLSAAKHCPAFVSKAMLGKLLRYWGRSSYGLWRAFRCHLELNCTEHKTIGSILRITM